MPIKKEPIYAVRSFTKGNGEARWQLYEVANAAAVPIVFASKAEAEKTLVAMNRYQRPRRMRVADNF